VKQNNGKDNNFLQFEVNRSSKNQVGWMMIQFWVHNYIFWIVKKGCLTLDGEKYYQSTKPYTKLTNKYIVLHRICL